jgi:gluconokinase
LANEQSTHHSIILTIDLGSSSLRCLIFQQTGELIPGLEARRTYEFTRGDHGKSEVDPDFLFNLLAECLDELLALAGPMAHRIAGVAFCTFWHNLLGMDEANRPLTPVLTWADTRSTSEVKILQKEFNLEKLHQQTGCHLHPSYLPAKLLWFRQNRPEIFNRAVWWGSIGEYILYRLFGQRVCSVSMASGTGLMDQEQCIWLPGLLKTLAISAQQLSPIATQDFVFQPLPSPYAERWPALKAVPWYPALGDGACSNLGSYCTDANCIALMVGTSGAMRVVFQGNLPRIPRGLWCYHVDRKRFLMGGALSNGGNLIQWMRETLQTSNNWAELETELQNIPPDSHGLTLLPFFAGERSIGWNPAARGVIAGLTLETRPAQLLLAAMETIAYRFGRILNKLENVFPAPRQIVATGGALEQSPLWVQIMADVLNQPILLTRSSEASSRGAALLAFENLGLIGPLESLPAPAGIWVRPRAQFRERYAAAQLRWETLYQKFYPPTSAFGDD